MNEKEFVLSIETAFAGGSLALLKEKKTLDCWKGTGTVSKAEDVLEEVTALLRRNKLSGKNLKTICAVKGKGSATGLRIGMSIAKGLARAFSSRFEEIDVEKTLSKYFTEAALIAFPLRKGRVYWKTYGRENSYMFYETSFEEFFEAVNATQEEKKIILHEDLYREVLKRNSVQHAELHPMKISIIENPAVFFGKTIT